jgi:hypothetical protein
MHIREQFQKLLDRKEQEILDLQLQIEKAKAYVQALQDSMRFLPKDDGQDDTTLRPGSALYLAQEVLRAAGKPMHITEILKALNKPTDKKRRLSLGGSLSGYVRKGQIFTRPAPNTFGLIETSKSSLNDASGASGEELDLPEEFGEEN